jgi:hypothetical protein
MGSALEQWLGGLELAPKTYPEKWAFAADVLHGLWEGAHAADAPIEDIAAIERVIDILEGTPCGKRINLSGVLEGLDFQSVSNP